jgi:hypothetical protein
MDLAAGKFPISQIRHNFRVASHTAITSRLAPEAESGILLQYV